VKIKLQKPWCPLVFLLMLTACGKTIKFTEEVQLPGSDKTIILERSEVFEPRMVRLSLKQTYIRSELSIVGSKLPRWKARLHPIYFGALPEDGAGYLLVATIRNSIGCYERGKPNSPYVVFVSGQQEWREIPMPKYLDGRTANLLLQMESRPPGNDTLSKEKIKELNRLVGVLPDEQTIQLSTRFGC